MIPRPISRYLVLLAFATLAVGVTLLPAAAEAGWSAAPGIYPLFAPICHQIGERSFFLLGHQLAVCQRCFGIYLGFWLGIFLLPVFPAFSSWLLGRPRRILLFALPMAVDLLLGNSALSRFSTGLAGGFPVASFVWAALEQTVLNPRNLVRRSHESSAT